MNTREAHFLQFAQTHGVLRFGEFKTKAGRLSPYFFNTGLLNTGSTLAALGQFYAQTLIEAMDAGKVQVDMLFGPAYKGIPLVATTAIACASLGRDLPFAFNRKEAKDHGEGGTIVGAPLKGKVIIIDDVISAGTSVRESVEIIRQQGAEPAGVLIAIDRMEKGGDALKPTEMSAVDEVRQRFGIPVFAIANLDGLLAWLDSDRTNNLAQWAAPVARYRDQWGASASA